MKAIKKGLLTPFSFAEGDDLRFTRSKDGKYVYVISLKWPGESLAVKSLRAKEGSRITLLGSTVNLKWRQDKNGWVVQIPSQLALHKPCAQAYVFKVEAEAYRKSYE